MQREGPPTIPVDDDIADWEATQMDDVFLPSVRVILSWNEVEKAVEAGAVVPAQAHAMWAGWAAPGSPLRHSTASTKLPAKDLPMESDEPEAPVQRAARPSLALRLGGPLAGAVVGALLTWLVVGG